MTSDSMPITTWIGQAQAGDAEAVERLWRALYPSVVRAAGRLLRGNRIRRIVDEDDLALSAFEKFRLAAVGGKLPTLTGRDHLWRLLLCNLRRKLLDRIRRERRTVHTSTPADLLSVPLHQPGSDSSLDYDVLLADELSRLDNDNQRQTAVMWMHGSSREEIASQLRVSVPTVDRWLRRIRTIWKEDLQ